MDIVLGILHGAATVFYYTWWFWVFILIGPLFTELWLFWKQETFKHHIDWTLLELRMPREVKKSPKAMEQVLAAFHSLRNAPSDFQDKYLTGEVTKWFSLELVSLGGEVHFFVRVPREHKEVVEAAFFSYYADLEVVEADEDYVDRIPKNMKELYEGGYELWGTELILTKDEAYPIKSYIDFESEDEAKQYDPISLFLEVLGKVKREEFVGIQLEIAPEGDSWKKHGEHLIEELRGTKKEGGHGSGAELGLEFPHILPHFPVKATEGKEESGASRALSRTPGETDTLKAVEENLALPGFETVIRFIYTSPKELYSDGFARRGVVAGFNQYASNSLNSFALNQHTATRAKMWTWPHVFPERRVYLRRERILFNYRHREVPPHVEIGRRFLGRFLDGEHSEHFILTTRSIATLFHPPTPPVLTAPHLRRIESRKAGPPSGLPIYGGEENIEKFR